MGMVAIHDIKDGDSFRAWLAETNQSQEACIALAVRASLRVLPLVWADAAERRRYSSLPFLRANLVANVAGVAPKALLTDAGHASALRAAARAAAGYATADARAAAWTAIRSDCDVLTREGGLRDKPLFAGASPKWFTRSYTSVREHSSSDCAFWLDWYARSLDGQPQNWPLLLEIALQPDEFWEGTDEEINARIAGIMARHPEIEEVVDLETLAQTIDQTKNGDRVFLNEAEHFDRQPLADLTLEELGQITARANRSIAFLRQNFRGANWYIILETSA